MTIRVQEDVGADGTRLARAKRIEAARRRASVLTALDKLLEPGP